MPRKPKAETRRSNCPIACSLDLVGDRWTLVIVRDLLRGLTKYGEFLGGEEGIPTNVLAERLVRLEEARLVTKTPYQQNPVRFSYELTAKGRTLAPVVGAIAMWGQKNFPGAALDPELRKLVEAHANS
ncbi:MAG TPA: helix-turn-helix domain-containing protein [Opitutaceae bacterium]|jgi:DNA-binding HxlR family transcriptional regulator|nr:helix-turn-helix domain-containing protein [Opitutaceae bacterium]